MMRRSRLEFTGPTKRAAFERSGGICECHRVPILMRILDGQPCGVKLSTGNIQYDHLIADALRPDNSLSNCCCLTKTCHALKSDIYDKKEIARAKRREDRHRGIRPTPRQALLGTFRSNVSRGFDGVPRYRDSGRRWPQPATAADTIEHANAIVGPSISLSHRVPVLEADPVITKSE